MVGLQLQLLDGTGHRISSSLSLFDDNADLSPVHLICQCAAHHLQRPLYNMQVHLHQLTLQSVHLLQHTRQDYLYFSNVKIN